MRSPLIRQTVTVAIVTLSVLFFTLLHQPSAAQAQEAVHSTAANSQLFLPLIVREGTAPPPNNFSPTAATQLAGGVQTFDGFTIPAGVTVTVQGPLTITVNGPITIAGSLVGDCVAITLLGLGDTAIAGALDNRCTDPNAENPGPLTIARTGAMTIGTAETPALVESSGDIHLTNDPTIEAWEFDVLEEQRSGEPLPPVCTAAADTLWATALPDDPAVIRFNASGADPDGGPVMFSWNFGDNTPPASGDDLTHAYTVAGMYTVTLTATDDDGQACTATLGLNIDDGEEANLPTLPAVQMQPAELVVAAGESVDFGAGAIDAQDEELAYLWDFGDSGTADVITGTHVYTAPGRYDITLVATDDEGNSRTATAAVYVHTASEVNAAAPTAPQAVCPPLAPPGAILINQFNIFNPPPAGPGRDGRNITHIWNGLVIINRGVAIRGQDGGNGRNGPVAATSRGGRGGNGGGVRFAVRGNLVVCSGVLLKAGDGGDGGTANAVASAGMTARAYGGKGGNAGRHALFTATGGITFEEPGITVDGGDAGDGGHATAKGGNGADRCNTAQNGGHAYAYGGEGGLASKAAIARGRVLGTLNVTLTGGWGGNGGDATATGGNGGNAICPNTAHGGNGGLAYARAGKGGNAYLTGAWRRYRINPIAFWAGDGGAATATGGTGGNGVATPAAACASTVATGGAGGAATALSGDGGRGRINGFGDQGQATGGVGGNANATGGDCPNCGKGGDATATAGRGGNATARRGSPAPVLDATQAQAGNGGEATATGGKGGDCPICPGGKGGDGGAATATGGDGANAAGNGQKIGGNGGQGDATGGQGGKGATCCEPPEAGGNGGNGGQATSNAGKAGAPGGAGGGNATSGGDGGNGGDGEGPGAGGPGGVGVGSPFDILDGIKGVDGKHCPKIITATPTPTITETVVTVTPTVTETVATATPVVTETTTCTPENCPTPTPSATPTPVPEPTITSVELTLSTQQTTPSQPVTLTAVLKGEDGQPVMVDSFFDLFFMVALDGINPQPRPANYHPSGHYQAVLEFPPGNHLVDVLVVRRADGTVLDLHDLQLIQVQEPPEETAQAGTVIGALGAGPGLMVMARWRRRRGMLDE